MNRIAESLKARAACLRPSHARIVLRDRRGRRSAAGRDEERLRAALDWLGRAQDAAGGGGVSAGYHFRGGWRPPYPETSGYIAATFLDAAAYLGESSWRDRAVAIGDWEISIQLRGGAVRGGQGVNDYPIVFNTGQVMIGWLALHRATGEQRFLDAAVRAGEWLAAVQDADGKWSRHTLNDIPHAYHSRVAWPLLECGLRADRPDLAVAAERFYGWLVGETAGKGWIRHMGFTGSGPVLTHTIAYTIRGLLEGANRLDGDLALRCREVATHAARQLFYRYERNKADPFGEPRPLPGLFDEGWRPAAAWSCLTGNCQLAIIWIRLARANDDARYLNASLKILDQVKGTQCLKSGNPGIRGGVAGSWPVTGRYIQSAYPNWAAKFLCDALMEQERAMAGLEARP